jgi:hypothetical protein
MSKATKINSRKNPCVECGAIFGNNHKKTCPFAHCLPTPHRKILTLDERRKKKNEYMKKWRIEARKLIIKKDG